MRASISIASTEVSNPATVMTLEAGERELLQVHVTRIYNNIIIILVHNILYIVAIRIHVLYYMYMYTY